MIDKYGMEVEDVDDFLDAFVSTRTLAKIPLEFHGPGLVQGNENMFRKYFYQWNIQICTII